nr:calphotin-like [Bactrocera oleae]
MSYLIAHVHMFILFLSKQAVVLFALIACAAAKSGLLTAAPLAYTAPAGVVAAAVPVVTATSSQVIARNYNGIAAAPIIAAAPVAAPLVAHYAAAAPLPAPLGGAPLVARYAPRHILKVFTPKHHLANIMSYLIAHVHMFILFLSKQAVVLFALIACAAAKSGLLTAAPLAYTAPAGVVAAAVPVVTATSSQVIARNYNGIAAAPIIAAAPVAAPLVAHYAAAAPLPAPLGGAPLVARYAAAPLAAPLLW